LVAIDGVFSRQDANAPNKGGIEPTFFRKPSSRQEGKKLHLECEIEALPRPEITWSLGDRLLQVEVKGEVLRGIILLPRSEVTRSLVLFASGTGRTLNGQ
jgi:hypothetical protein